MRVVQRLWLAGGSVAAAAVMIALLAAVAFLGTFGAGEVTAATGWVPPVALGILAPLAGSVSVASLALTLGGGTAYLAATSLSCERPPLRTAFLGLFAAGAWMPTVVLALFGVVWLQPVLGGYGILPVVIVLALATFWPAVGRFTAALDALPEDVLGGAMALGAEEAVARRFLAPAAARGALGRTVASLAGRLVGEGTVTTLLIGNNGLFPPGLLHPSATLASVLLTEGGGAPPGSAWESALWALALAVAIMAALLGRTIGSWSD